MSETEVKAHAREGTRGVRAHRRTIRERMNDREQDELEIAEQYGLTPAQVHNFLYRRPTGPQRAAYDAWRRRRRREQEDLYA